MACRPHKAVLLYKKLRELAKQAQDNGSNAQMEAYNHSADMMLETFPVWLTTSAQNSFD